MLRSLAELDGATRHTPDGPLFVAEGSPAHERYVALVESSDPTEGEELIANVWIDCGEGSPTQARCAAAITGLEPEQLRTRLDALDQGATGDFFTAPYRPAPRSMWSGGPQRVNLRRPRGGRHRGRSRECRAAPPRRRGARQATGSGSRAGPAAGDSDPDSAEPPPRRLQVDPLHAGGRP